MTSERIKQIQKTTTYPNSVSVKQALLQVWNECSQQTKDKDKEIEELRKERDRLKKRNIVLSNDCCNANEAYTRKGIEITQLKNQLKEKSEEVKKAIDFIKDCYLDLKLIDNKHYGWEEYDAKHRLKKLHKLLNNQ